MFTKLQEIESREIVKGYHAKFIHSANNTLAYWVIEKDALLPEHSHMHEQVYSGKAITGCKILDVFYPIRKDYE